MSEKLIQTAVRACVTLSQEIDAIAADENLSKDPDVTEVWTALCTVYADLTDRLSVDLHLDARKLVQDLIVAETESMRALLRAKGVPC
jgi:hypothetical protein